MYNVKFFYAKTHMLQGILEFSFLSCLHAMSPSTECQRCLLVTSVRQMPAHWSSRHSCTRADTRVSPLKESWVMFAPTARIAPFTHTAVHDVNYVKNHVNKPRLQQQQQLTFYSRLMTHKEASNKQQQFHQIHHDFRLEIIFNYRTRVISVVHYII